MSYYLTMRTVFAKKNKYVHIHSWILLLKSKENILRRISRFYLLQKISTSNFKWDFTKKYFVFHSNKMYFKRRRTKKRKTFIRFCIFIIFQQVFLSWIWLISNYFLEGNEKKMIPSFFVSKSPYFSPFLILIWLEN